VKQAAAFLKKSGAKNFYLYESRDVWAPTAQIKKVFCFFSSEKKRFLPKTPKPQY
jgi:hypothetical protein